MTASPPCVRPGGCTPHKVKGRAAAPPPSHCPSWGRAGWPTQKAVVCGVWGRGLDTVSLLGPTGGSVMAQAWGPP